MQQKNYKLVIKPLIICAALLFIVAQLLIPQSTALAYVYFDNISSGIIPITKYTLLNNIDIPITGGAGASPTLYINIRATQGHYSEIDRIHIFGDSKLLIYTEVKLNVLTIHADINDMTYGASYSVDYDITVSTLPNIYIIYYITIEANKLYVGVEVNGNYKQVISPKEYGLGILSDNTILYNCIDYDLNTALDLAVINQSTKVSYGIGLISRILITSLELRAQTTTYSQGYNAGVAAAETTNTMAWLQTIWTGLDTCLSIEILPNFKLWYLVGLPVSLSLLFFILKLIRGN